MLARIIFSPPHQRGESSTALNARSKNGRRQRRGCPAPKSPKRGGRESARLVFFSAQKFRGSISPLFRRRGSQLAVVGAGDAGALCPRRRARCGASRISRACKTLPHFLIFPRVPQHVAFTCVVFLSDCLPVRYSSAVRRPMCKKKSAQDLTPAPSVSKSTAHARGTAK